MPISFREYVKHTFKVSYEYIDTIINRAEHNVNDEAAKDILAYWHYEYVQAHKRGEY